jgi:Ca2+-binding EF-hand superfamily protein
MSAHEENSADRVAACTREREALAFFFAVPPIASDNKGSKPCPPEDLVSLTPFQQRKFGRMFRVLDVNSDGIVDRQDFVERVERLARLCNWAPDSPQYQRNLQFALQEWENLRETAEIEGDGGITRDEFLRIAEVFYCDRQAVRAYARGDARLLFDAMDTDGDGKVTVREYGRYLEVCGLDASAADVFFHHADLNEDGSITSAEMTHAIEEFLLSEDASVGGSYLFGPLQGDETP